MLFYVHHLLNCAFQFESCEGFVRAGLRNKPLKKPANVDLRYFHINKAQMTSRKIYYTMHELFRIFSFASLKCLCMLNLYNVPNLSLLFLLCKGFNLGLLEGVVKAA